MAAIQVIVQPVKDEKIAKKIIKVFSKPSEKPYLSKEAEELSKKISFKLK